MEETMSAKENLKLIDEFARAYGPVKAALEEISLEAMSYVPDEPVDAWSINDHLVHLLDADMMLWYRARVAVAEPDSTIPVWQETLWKERLRYEMMDGRTCLNLAESVRAAMADGFRPMAEADWSTYAIIHPVRGRMLLTDVLVLYRDHAATHLSYIERNLAAYVSG